MTERIDFMYKRRYSKKRCVIVLIGKSDRQVSVRLPKEIYDIIDSYEGKNFSDKLVNYIFDHEM